MRISYITLAVNDIANMRRFYTALGFQLFKQSDNEGHPFTLYQSGELVLALYPRNLLAKQAGLIVEEAGEISLNGVSNSLSLNMDSAALVDVFVKKAKEYGATVCREGFTPEWGGYCAYIKDPEMNLWEIVWHPNFSFTSL